MRWVTKVVKFQTSQIAKGLDRLGVEKSDSQILTFKVTPKHLTMMYHIFHIVNNTFLFLTTIMSSNANRMVQMSFNEMKRYAPHLYKHCVGSKERCKTMLHQ